MSDRVRLGLIGVQAWGHRVAEQMAASDTVELAWVYDINSPAAEQVGAEFGARVAHSLDELLAGDAIGVVIVTPNHTHMELGSRVATAGKHPMVIKPIANTLAEGRELIDACRRAGVFCATNHPLRKSPFSQRVKTLLDAGQFGRLMLAVSVTGHNGVMRRPPTDWRMQRRTAPGGPLLQLTIHTFDTWQYWFGPIEAIQATGGHRAIPGNNDDYFAGQARFADGLIGNFATQYAAPGANFQAVYGTGLTIGEDAHGVFAAPAGAGPAARLSGPVTLDAYSDIRRDIEDFAADIAAGRQPHASGEDGLRALACVHAAIRSSEQGGAWVNIDDVLGER